MPMFSIWVGLCDKKSKKMDRKERDAKLFEIHNKIIDLQIERDRILNTEVEGDCLDCYARNEKCAKKWVRELKTR